ncbi:hypothetical protein CYY_003182 [Polysphondylium violaceum]|uniref:Uncharacterized protein n=1 Tax=Polysphondylium violaceum TaxID=133409 RepID=A0A8J4UUJ4_9MYCE|nr:hypothetical protein CYY_003182 [Polysphondylium violaceum]
MITSTTTNTFYSIWRSSYLRNLIRGKINDGAVISVDLPYLDSYHEYLSSIDNSNNNRYIFIKLNIKDKDHFIEYLNHPFRHVINFLYFTDVVDISLLPLEPIPKIQQQRQHNYMVWSKTINHTYQIRFDCSLIPDSVVKLSVFAKDDVLCTGHLPDSITALDVYKSSLFQAHSSLVDYVLRNPPTKLKSLSLPNDFIMNVMSKYTLPSTLVDFHYMSSVESLQSFVVSQQEQQQKVLKGCTLVVKKLESFDWLHDNPWVTQVNLIVVPVTERDPPIPLHVTHITTTNVAMLNTDILPPGLESLTCLSNLTIFSSRPPNLKYLYLDTYRNKLTPNLLPNTLEHLEIVVFNEPIDKGVLPPHLKTLCLESFDQDLREGVIPASLTNLQLYRFKKLLRPSVLPAGLKNLFLYEFNNCATNLQAHSLPISLTSLSLNSYRGSYDCVGPLNNLKSLSIHSLHPSLSRLVSNVETIKISFTSIDTHTSNSKKSKESEPSVTTNLVNTTIQNLVISYQPTSSKAYDTKFHLYPEFLPFSLVKLETIGVEIHSAGLFPKSCVYLKTDMKNLNLELIPPTVKYIK